MSNKILTKCQKYGLLVNDFNIINFSFSEEFDKAIEEKQANELKEKTLTDNVIKEKFIEKWNGELPKVTGNNGILDISKLLN